MSSDKSASEGLKAAVHRFGKFLFSHNRMIYFVLFLLAISGAVLGLNLALSQPSDQDYYNAKVSETQSPRFDNDTIDKIQNLNAKQQTIINPPPAGQRTNPFGE
jgi:hypothetical protein